MISLTFSSYKSRMGTLHISLQIIKTLGYIDVTIKNKKDISFGFLSSIS
jgi:hypothetical protein